LWVIFAPEYVQRYERFHELCMKRQPIKMTNIANRNLYCQRLPTVKQKPRFDINVRQIKQEQFIFETFEKTEKNYSQANCEYDEL
jgi:hypothetical protein